MEKVAKEDDSQRRRRRLYHRNESFSSQAVSAFGMQFKCYSVAINKNAFMIIQWFYANDRAHRECACSGEVRGVSGTRNVMQPLKWVIENMF